MARNLCQWILVSFGGRGTDNGSLILAVFHQAHDHQFMQGIAHGGAADSWLQGQIALRHQPTAGLR